MPASKLPVRRKSAAEVLGPWPIKTTAHDHMANPPCSQFLWKGRKRHESVDLSFGKPLHRLCCRIHDKVDVPCRIEADIGRHARDEKLVRRLKLRHRDRLALEV